MNDLILELILLFSILFIIYQFFIKLIRNLLCTLIYPFYKITNIGSTVVNNTVEVIEDTVEVIENIGLTVANNTVEVIEDTVEVIENIGLTVVNNTVEVIEDTVEDIYEIFRDVEGYIEEQTEETEICFKLLYDFLINFFNIRKNNTKIKTDYIII